MSNDNQNAENAENADENADDLKGLYCEKCDSCGESGCCSPLRCAYTNMVINGKGEYCEEYYWELAIAYEVSNKLTLQQLNDIGFDEILDQVYKRRDDFNKRRDNSSEN